MYESSDFERIYKDAHLAKIKQGPEVMSILTEWITDPKHILFYFGNVGTGKTYLCAAWYQSLREERKNVRAYTEQSFFRDLKITIQNGWDPGKRIRDICDADYCILDDMGSSTMTEWQKEMLFDFINQRNYSNLPTLITSNMTKEFIEKEFTQRFNSRLMAKKHTFLHLNGPDRRCLDNFE